MNLVQAAVVDLATRWGAGLHPWPCVRTQAGPAVCLPQPTASMASGPPLAATTSPLAWAWCLLSSLEILSVLLCPCLSAVPEMMQSRPAASYLALQCHTQWTADIVCTTVLQQEQLVNRTPFIARGYCTVTYSVPVYRLCLICLIAEVLANSAHQLLCAYMLARLSCY